jgi:hypothetical protein
MYKEFFNLDWSELNLKGIGRNILLGLGKRIGVNLIWFGNRKKGKKKTSNRDICLLFSVLIILWQNPNN